MVLLITFGFFKDTYADEIIFQGLFHCISLSPSIMKIISFLFLVLTWEIAILRVKSDDDFLQCSNVKVDSDFPNITVSDYANETQIKYNATNIVLPNTLKSLELKCTASYPIQWGFQKYPYIKLGNWEIETKRREVQKDATSNETKYVFESYLTFPVIRESVLEQKYPTCYHQSLNNKCLQTSLNATSTNAVNIQIQRGTDLALNAKGKFGENKDCTLILSYDFDSEKFYCQSVNGKRPVLFVASCSDPVTCGALTTKTNCSNTPKIPLSECNAKTSCRSADLRVNYLPAVAVCMIQGLNSYSATTEYFYSFPINKTAGRKPRDYRYFNWYNVPPENMLDVSNLVNETHFAGEKFNIHCNGSYYYFASGFKFKIQDVSNEIPIRDYMSTESVIKIPATIGVDTLLPSNRSLILQDYYFSLPGEFEIICSAPVWNSTDWVSKSTRVTILESQKPLFFDENNKTETLYYKPKKYIHCAAFGIPKPDITWSLDGNPLPPTIHQIPGVQNETESWRDLLFPDSISGIYGNFTCRIKNVAGYDEKTFILLPNDPSSSIAMIVVAVIGVLALVLVPLIIYLSWKVRRNTKATWTQADVDAFFGGQDVNLLTCDTKTYAYNLPYNRSYEIPRQNIVIDLNSVLGEGAYGIVYSAEMMDTSTNPPKVIKKLAMKTLKPIFSSEMFFKALLCELKILSFIGKHENIVNLEGACTDKLIRGEVLVALEFCENGSLLEYIRGNRHTYYNPMVVADILVEETSFINVQYVQLEDLTNVPLNTNNNENSHEPITFKNLLSWAHQIANGMEFLASKKVIHGDLAARNVLLDSNLTAKISDFGLSKRLFNYSTYLQSSTNPLPAQWMAIECLRELECSIESDIWSYGVTLWEIFSLGNTPYRQNSGIDMTQMEILEILCQGMRLSKPKFASIQIFDVMMSCWRNDRRQRPNFKTLSSYFKQCAELPMEYVHPTLVHRFSSEET